MKHNAISVLCQIDLWPSTLTGSRILQDLYQDWINSHVGYHSSSATVPQSSIGVWKTVMIFQITCVLRL